MRRYRSANGEEKLWFEPFEIDDIIEGELKKAGFYPSPEHPFVNIERFLEVYLHAVLDQHANLEKDILGVTTFLIGQQPKVEINHDLTDAIDNGEENISVLGRWRATLAHEGAHIVLHRPLFQISENQGNFFSETNNLSSKEVIIKCFKKNVGFSRGQVDWREYQANKGMAAILMPQGLVKKLANELVPDHDKLVEDYSREAVSLIESISDLFQVSRQAAEIRLKDVGIIIPRGQTQMKTM
jgi:hypothetical protein